ncbi:hypothetical protein CPter91_3447 [Collimonas pratensis]|uniref:Uncharacterized protein n=1 Tax=Collimonas pratensis TaxID=279113 RepID=A0A127Q6X6_9BURK|nr:hypothetical protein CPter91_3447 [Collimonas pratensis]
MSLSQLVKNGRSKTFLTVRDFGWLTLCMPFYDLISNALRRECWI